MNDNFPIFEAPWDLDKLRAWADFNLKFARTRGFRKHSAAEVRFAAVLNALDILKTIQDALGTAEYGAALVEVARNAHRAEQELAERLRHEEEGR